MSQSLKRRWLRGRSLPLKAKLKIILSSLQLRLRKLTKKERGKRR